jgi:chromosome segregation ATPase
LDQEANANESEHYFCHHKSSQELGCSSIHVLGQISTRRHPKALNEDTEKLLQQGDPSDPQLRCLQRKIEEVNQLFCDFERREATCNRPELSQSAIDDHLATLQMKLEEFEMTLTSMITSPLPRDLDQLEQFVVNQRQFETELQSLQLELESIKENVEACPCKTPQMQTKYY